MVSVGVSVASVVVDVVVVVGRRQEAGARGRGRNQGEGTRGAGGQSCSDRGQSGHVQGEGVGRGADLTSLIQEKTQTTLQQRLRRRLPP